ncbi:hypothetical protein L916_10141, partial [Phytophthora nicotianae]
STLQVMRRNWKKGEEGEEEVVVVVVDAEEGEVVVVVDAEEVGAGEAGAEEVGSQEEECIEDTEDEKKMKGMKLSLCHPVLTWVQNSVVPMVKTSQTRPSSNLDKKCCQSTSALPSASMLSSSPS